MALVECAECGHRLSEHARAYPDCGAPATAGGSAISGRQVFAAGLVLLDGGLMLMGTGSTLSFAGDILLVTGLLGVLL